MIVRVLRGTSKVTAALTGLSLVYLMSTFLATAAGSLPHAISRFRLFFTISRLCHRGLWDLRCSPNDVGELRATTMTLPGLLKNGKSSSNYQSQAIERFVTADTLLYPASRILYWR